jgi:hypothetical protein
VTYFGERYPEEPSVGGFGERGELIATSPISSLLEYQPTALEDTKFMGMRPGRHRRSSSMVDLTFAGRSS